MDSGRTSICSATNEICAAGGRSSIRRGGPDSGDSRHQGVAEATVIAPTPLNHGGICLAQCAVAHQLTPIGRLDRTVRRSGLWSVAVRASPVSPRTLRPAADPGQGVDEHAASDAEDAANPAFFAPLSSEAGHATAGGFPQPGAAVSSMPAPVASGWSESPGGARTHWKAPPCHGALSLRLLLGSQSHDLSGPARDRAGLDP
jgi:hypothetical protein